jgi:hypothetical protein
MVRRIKVGGVLGLGLLVVALLALGAAASPVLAQGPAGDGMMGGGMMGGGMMGGGMMGGGMMGGGMMGRGYMGGGMMGGWGPGSGYSQGYTDTVPYGYGPMGRMGMMMGGGWEGCPMTGGWNAVDPDAAPLTLQQATENAEKFLTAFGNDDLKLAEVMEFTGNFYAEVHEKSTGIGAFELLVDRYTGEVSPEPGPNMMWNLKYGHMGGYGMMRWRGGAPEATMPVTPEQALEQAQKYLDRFNAGLTAGEVESFYGYYTLHTERDGQLTGMLSVNGYTGAVWYHNWHGDFVAVGEMDM